MSSPTSTESPAPTRNLSLRRKIVAFGATPILLLFSVILAIPAAPLYISNPSIFIALLLTILAEVATIVFALVWTGAARRWTYNLKFRGFYFKKILLGFGVGIGFYVGLQLLSVALSALGFATESSDTSKSIGELSGPLLWIVVIGFVSILAPLLEETLFRGVIVSSLRKTNLNAPWISILVSAVSFGVVHIQGFSSVTDITVAVWITFIGAVLAYLYIRTGWLWTTITAHLTYNLISGVIMLAGIGS